MKGCNYYIILNEAEMKNTDNHKLFDDGFKKIYFFPFIIF